MASYKYIKAAYDIWVLSYLPTFCCYRSQDTLQIARIMCEVGNLWRFCKVEQQCKNSLSFNEGLITLMHYYLGVWTRCYATLFNLVILASRPTTTPFATLLYWRPNKKNWRALGGRTKQKIDGRTLFGNASLFFLTHKELFLNLYFFKVAQKQEKSFQNSFLLIF